MSNPRSLHDQGARQKLAIQMRTLVLPMQELGVSMPADIQAAIDTAFFLTDNRKQDRPPLPDLASKLRDCNGDMSRRTALGRHVEILEKRFLHEQVSRYLNRAEDDAHIYASNMIKRRAGTELIDLLKPVFAEAVEGLAKTLKAHPVVMDQSYETVIQQRSKALAAYAEADAAINVIAQVHSLAAQLANDWQVREAHPHVTEWDPASLSKEITLRMLGDPYAVGSGGSARPVPSMREVLARGGIPRLMNQPEAKAAVNAFEQAKREAFAEVQQRTMRWAPMGYMA